MKRFLSTYQVPNLAAPGMVDQEMALIEHLREDPVGVLQQIFPYRRYAEVFASKQSLDLPPVSLTADHRDLVTTLWESVRQDHPDDDAYSVVINILWNIMTYPMLPDWIFSGKVEDAVHLVGLLAKANRKKLARVRETLSEYQKLSEYEKSRYASMYLSHPVWYGRAIREPSYRAGLEHQANKLGLQVVEMDDA